MQPPVAKDALHRQAVLLSRLHGLLVQVTYPGCCLATVKSIAGVHRRQGLLPVRCCCLWWRVAT